MSNARQGWNAAQLASERPLSERKSHAPVGEWKSAESVRYRNGAEERNMTCRHCGYHVCSCFFQELPPNPLTGSAALRAIYDSPIRVGEPEVSTALLTYDQAVAACRAGATLQITGGVREDAKEWIGAHLRFVHGFFQTNRKGPWTFCRLEDNGVQFRIVP